MNDKSCFTPCISCQEKDKEIERLSSCPNESWECARIQKRLENEINRLKAALERITGMCDVPGNCKCGRPNGIPAIVSCATKALAGGKDE